MVNEADISIDTVYHELEVWRDSKGANKQASMPDDLSVKIVLLANRIGDQKVRTLCGLSSEQLKRKREKFSPSLGLEPVTVLPDQTAREGVTMSVSPQRHYQPDPLPTKKTVIVELHDAQGRIMKIHATDESVEEVIRAFYRVQSCYN